ncbi:hypothetical protein [Okeania sp. SIO2G5]|uniref:hypothetical protein n=1 Tax=Okeania sp. SIO2G5 TaxID=2607796 RepID=UPI0013C17235|nr:hypothetical protein [Okeania sp. SIO2G5]NEP76421.1 hypothetical protein [Okeania sp. SIO2G5]
MLFDPEKPTRIDTDTLIPTKDKKEAYRRCREKADEYCRMGEVCELCGVIPSTTGKSHKCVFKFELEE